MAFLKRNVLMLLCLVVSLGSIGVAYMGCSQFQDVEQSMEQAADFAQRAQNAGRVEGKNRPVVPADIEVQEQNKEVVGAAVERVTQRAININKAGLEEYLVPEAFPDPTKIMGVNLQFIQRYKEALQALPAILQAKGPPTQEDIDAAQRDIDAEREALGLAPEGGAAAGTKTERPARARPRGPAIAPERRSRGRFAEALRSRGGLDRLRAPTPARRTRADAETDKGAEGEEASPRFDARRRAEIERAQSIRCYIGPDPFQTFTAVASAMDPTVREPDPYSMWIAQMTLWVQREILRALAGVNDAVATQVLKDPKANVTQLPVKRLLKLSVGDYRKAAIEETPGKGAARGRGRAKAPAPRPRGRGLQGLGALGSPRTADKRDSPEAVDQPALTADLNAPSWTGRQSGPDLDVVPISIQLILDQRYLEKVVDAITRANFYVPTLVKYRAPNRGELRTEYIYGDAPLVEVTMTFERYFFPQVYAEKMPKAVHMALGHPIPGEEDERARGRGRRGRARR